MVMNQREFTAQVLACERKMYRMAYCMLHNSADCQDAVQDAIFSAWKNHGRLRDESSFDSWMMQILVNSCRDTLRRRKRRAECELTDMHALPESPDIRLYDAVRSLEERYRLPVILRYVNGYTAQEVANILRLPYRTVLSRLRTAKELLKTQLKEVEV